MHRYSNDGIARPPFAFGIALMLLACLAPASAPAKEPADAEEAPLRPEEDTRGILTFAFENDVFMGKDNGYTNGLRLSWLSPESDIPAWIQNAARRVPFFSRSGRKRYALAIGQSMYAPDDLSLRTIDPNDRPYAGWLYTNIGIISDTGYRLDNLQLSLGVVGPSSLAAELQDAIHHIRGSRDPQGWDNQLEDEPALMLTYERKWRNIYEFSPFGMGMDLTPSMRGSLGNVFTNASTGVMARFGYDLPSDYGPPLIQPSLPGSDFFVPSQTLGWYFFASLEGQAVLHNIFLDGNTFHDSHSVDKEHFVGSLQLGLALTYQQARLAYTHILRTREFKTQDEPDAFGAVTLSYRF